MRRRAEGKRTIEQRILRALVVVGLVLVALFGLRTVRFAVLVARTGLERGTTSVESIRGWMPLPYVARAFEMPEGRLFAAIDAAVPLPMPAERLRKRSITALNRRYAPDRPGIVMDTVREAVAEHLQSQ